MNPTPTSNRRVPFRPGGFSNLREALDYAATGLTGVNFYDARGALTEVMTYTELREEARDLARRWRGMPLEPGDRIAMVAETSARFLIHFYASQYAGLVPCTLPHRMLAGGREAYAAQLRGLLERIAPSAAFAPTRVLPDVRGAAAEAIPVFAFDDAGSLAATRRDDELPAFDPSIPAYVQFSSGSTSQPKGIVVQHSALMHNATAIAVHGLRMEPWDRACSWLPLYHDMGLVGFSVVALCGQRSVDYLSPTTFAARPVAWLRLMSQRRSTIVYAPAFAWRLAAQRYRGEPDIDLSALRVAGIGGDMIAPQMIETCANALAPTGFRLSAFQPSYGMAEATLAVSMSPVGATLRLEPGDSEAQDTAQHPARLYVGCGHPLPGVDVRVEDAAGNILPERAAGRLWIRGPNVMRSYHPHADATSETARADGFFDSGDIGFLADGEVFPTGRSKELIILRGRNLWPQDVEWLVERLPGLKAGDVAAIGVPDAHDEESLTLLVQRAPRTERSEVEMEVLIAGAVAEALGVVPHIVFIPPGSLPFTSSGKLARAQARASYLSGQWPAGAHSSALLAPAICDLERQA